MGRNVCGDFDWGFAFARQDSNFGEMLDKLFDGCLNIMVNRYTNDAGEIIKFWLDDIKEFNEILNVYLMECNLKGIIPDMKDKRDGDYWTYMMMRKFKEEMTEEKQYEFEVEY